MKGARPAARAGGLPARIFGVRRDAEEAVKAIKVPVEVIVGETDPCRMLYVEPLHAIRPDWPVQVIAKAGHIVCVMKTGVQDGTASRARPAEPWRSCLPLRAWRHSNAAAISSTARPLKHAIIECRTKEKIGGSFRGSIAAMAHASPFAASLFVSPKGFPKAARNRKA